MGAPGRRRKSGEKTKGSGSGSRKSSSGKAQHPAQRQRRDAKESELDGNNAPTIKPIPVLLQQLLLNVFKAAFLEPSEDSSSTSAASLSQKIQTLKAHLYRRDFDSAFADASQELLEAYALRWSAGRSLAYAGIFWSFCERFSLFGDPTATEKNAGRKRIVCVGGGAGAEIAACAAVRRIFEDQLYSAAGSGGSETDPCISELTLNDTPDKSQAGRSSSGASEADQSSSLNASKTRSSGATLSDLSITAVDIADWSSLLQNLTATLSSKSVPSTRTYPTPLLQSAAYESQKGPFTVDFKKADVLKLSDEELRSLFLPANLEQPAETVLVTLMFTLNELLATSMPKTVSFLLRLTDLTQPNTLLLVVDSPGSYSTVSLGSTKSTPVSTASASARESDREETVNSERKYPLRFLLEHTLLSVASGRWECVMSEESRWFRREQTSLRYDLGDGVGLEDMRYQIHAYKRTA